MCFVHIQHRGRCEWCANRSGEGDEQSIIIFVLAHRKRNANPDFVGVLQNRQTKTCQSWQLVGLDGPKDKQVRVPRYGILQVCV